MFNVLLGQAAFPLALRSQESLATGVDEVVSSQPYITDPNEAWGDEPAPNRSVTSAAKATPDPFGDVDAFTKASLDGMSTSKDPFG